MIWYNTMGTNTVPINNCLWVYKDNHGTFICWSGTEPNAQVNNFSWVFITSKTVHLSIYPSICLYFYRSISWSIDRLIDGLISWLVGPSVYPSIGCWVGCWVGWLVDWSVDPSVHLSVSRLVRLMLSYPFVHPLVRPSVCWSFRYSIHLYFNWSFSPSVHWSVRQCVDLYFHLSTYPSICKSIQTSVGLFVYLSIRPSVFPFIRCSIRAFVRLSFGLSIRLFVGQPIRWSVCPFTGPLVCLVIHRSVGPSFHALVSWSVVLLVRPSVHMCFIYFLRICLFIWLFWHCISQSLRAQTCVVGGVQGALFCNSH